MHPKHGYKKVIFHTHINITFIWNIINYYLCTFKQMYEIPVLSHIWPCKQFNISSSNAAFMSSLKWTTLAWKKTVCLYSVRSACGGNYFSPHALARVWLADVINRWWRLWRSACWNRILTLQQMKRREADCSQYSIMFLCV